MDSVQVQILSAACWSAALRLGKEFIACSESRSEISFKVGVQKNLKNITRKYLCWSPFFNKVAGFQVVAFVLGSEFTKLFQIEISRQIAVNFTLKTNDSFQANAKGNPLNNEKIVKSQAITVKKPRYYYLASNR